MGDVSSLPLSLKDSLKRGVLITAANWHVVVVQFVADALFKTLLAVPIVGGVFLAVLLIGGDPGDLLARPVTEIVPTMASVLLAQPIALVRVPAGARRRRHRRIDADVPRQGRNGDGAHRGGARGRRDRASAAAAAGIPPRHAVLDGAVHERRRRGSFRAI